MELTSDVRYLKGIGEKKALALGKLGVFSLLDLLNFFPRRYEDRSTTRLIRDCVEGESVCVSAVVAEEPRLSRIRRGLELVKFRAVDESGSLDVTYFNQSYLADQLHRGDEVIFFGRVEKKGTKLSMINPVFERSDSPRGQTGRIVPVYRMSAGLNQRSLQQAVRLALDGCGERLPDVLPAAVRERQKLVQTRYAYENIHFPADFGALELARRRLIFEELFVLACALSDLRRQRSDDDGLPVKPVSLEDFYRTLPFSPTGAQRRAVAQAVEDLQSGRAMSRLVQGDVGSGKTLVAAALIYYISQSGYQSAFMAPTELLAEQHTATLAGFLAPMGLRVGKLTGSMTAKEKRLVKQQLSAGDLDLVVGTHALFSEDVSYASLGLVVTDEQHRFGVGQRAALIGKGRRPHVLVMSATPIPRTLALILYGDLDVSIIDELPPGRQKVDTFAVDESYRARLNGFIRKLVSEGRQVFVVCPMVEENEELAVPLKSAEEHHKELEKTFPELRIGLVHGKQKAKDKDATMAAFVRGELDVLVATTVIEVGVDVPNAALMIVENAERFGLSQLHQLRGRVGRGQHKSWCILISDNNSEEVRARLDIMHRTNDGFKISEEDLRLRGPGDFFGSRQHGLPEMHVADLGADVKVLETAREEALRLLESDPELKEEEHRALKEKIDALFRQSALSFN